MIGFLKYIVVPLLGVALACLSNYLEGWKLSKVVARRIRCCALLASVVAILVQGVVSWREDRLQEAQRERDRSDLQTRIDDLKERNGEMRDELTSTRGELGETRKELHWAHAELAQANSNLQMQARSIGSLVFNLGSSDEGKRRFARCFQDLSRITGRREKPIVYEGLICDNGVAIFGFEQETECLKEFFHFTEAEINHVLSGTQLENRFVSEANQVNVASDSELALIDKLTRARVPMASDDPIEHERATARVDELMKTVFRYVYRSAGTNLGWWQEQNTGRAVGRRVTFSYAADPLADTPRMLCAELDMPLAEFESYFGLSVRDFNARLIETCRVHGIEPKVRIRDIRGMDARARGKEDHRTFPYQK